MKTKSWDIHILDRTGGVQTAKHENDFTDQIGPQLAAVIMLKQTFEATMPNASDHESNYVN